VIEFCGGSCDGGSVHGGSWAVALFSVLGNGTGKGVAQGASAAHMEGRGAHRAGATASCGARTRAAAVLFAHSKGLRWQGRLAVGTQGGKPQRSGGGCGAHGQGEKGAMATAERRVGAAQA
jgi:hypothetical protein